MGAGGVIQKQSEVLLTAISDPSIYNQLDDDRKDRVELIRADNPLARSKDDVKFLSQAIHNVICPEEDESD